MGTAWVAVTLTCSAIASSGESPNRLSPLGQGLAAYVAEAEKEDGKLAADLARFRERQLAERKKGWRPPWDGYRTAKGRRHYEKLTTAQLARECLSTGLLAHECLVYDRPAFGIARAGVFHDGFAVLYAREDLWEGIAAACEDFAARLPKASDLHDRMNILMGLQTMKYAYAFPEFRKRLTGREQRLLAAHLKAFAAVRSYAERTARLRKDGKTSGFFGPGVAYGLACSSLLLIKRASPAAYPEALRTLAGGRLSFSQTDPEEVIRFADLASAVVAEALARLQQRTPAATSRPA
ncbi:MAG: hypothetical protein WBF17_05980 [Phycisphaerae bacterium]